MTTGSATHPHRIALVAAAVLLVASATAAPLFHAGKIETPTPAEEKFADAPDGVDPVVTGPRTADLRERQQVLNCESAVWPNVPLGCYPG
jgi:hypothetical protein